MTGDKRQPPATPERITLTPFADGFICDAPTPSMQSCAEPGTPIPYARVHPDDARVEEIRERWSKVRYDCGAADENSYADDVGYLLSLLHPVSSSEPRLKDGGVEASRDDVVAAITDMQEGWESHVQWAAHLRNTNRHDCVGCADHAAHIGEASYHDEWIEKYDRVIRLLALVPIATESSGRRCGECGLLKSESVAWHEAIPFGNVSRALDCCRCQSPVVKDKAQAALNALRQQVEDTIIVAQTDTDADGFITAYHFKTGAIHRLLAKAREGDGPIASTGADKEDPPWVDADGHTWDRRSGVECVECPDCCFTFAAVHGDSVGGYSCPNCNKGEMTSPTAAAVAAAREWMNTHHASFETNQKREEALAAIISKHCSVDAGEVARLQCEVGRLASWQADVEEREAACCPEDVPFDEYIRSLEGKLADSRATAIGESRDAVAAALRASRETFIPINKALEVSATALESLQKEHKNG